VHDECGLRGADLLYILNLLSTGVLSYAAQMCKTVSLQIAKGIGVITGRWVGGRRGDIPACCLHLRRVFTQWGPSHEKAHDKLMDSTPRLR
jgi:hypothetical protein